MSGEGRGIDGCRYFLFFAIFRHTDDLDKVAELLAVLNDSLDDGVAGSVGGGPVLETCSYATPAELCGEPCLAIIDGEIDNSLRLAVNTILFQHNNDD